MGASNMGMDQPHLSTTQYDLIYNLTSLGLASMGASTAFFFLRLSSFTENYRAALCFTGLVTFIAMYHYFRIFQSFEAAYTPCAVTANTRTTANGLTTNCNVINPYDCSRDDYGYSPTGHGFNDAYRYVDWLLTVPLLLIEIVLVMRLSEAETFNKSCILGVSSALMIAFGYPVVYTIPMYMDTGNGKEGLSAGATVAIQIGYTFSDIISKCGVGYLVYRIGLAKSMMERGELKNGGEGASIVTTEGNAAASPT